MLKPCLWLGPVLSGSAGLLETFYREASPVINLFQTCCKVQRGPAEGQSPEPLKQKATWLYRDGLAWDRPDDTLHLLGWVWGGMGMLWRGGIGAWWLHGMPALRDPCQRPGETCAQNLGPVRCWPAHVLFLLIQESEFFSKPTRLGLD